MKPSVSVIIPVYNVLNYLERCINSVRSQTWHNLEILLIDDGSTDGSGAACDYVASQDDRIKVVHQKNAGLSAARNVGLDLATGDFLTFVDSDDWVHPRYVEAMMDAQANSHARMVICQWIPCSGEQDPSASVGKIEIIDRDEAIPRMLKGEWVSAWAKLYHRSLFEDLRFPVGKYNEDYAILIYLFERCDVICLIPDVLYYYFKREGSITHSLLNVHSFDEFINGMDVWTYCRQKNAEWGNLALFNVTASIIKRSGACLLENRFMDKYDQMKRVVFDHRKQILGNPALPFKYHPFLWALMIGPRVHRSLMKAYYKR